MLSDLIEFMLEILLRGFGFWRTALCVCVGIGLGALATRLITAEPLGLIVAAVIVIASLVIGLVWEAKDD